ncbi:MAG TPA: hypothetical protein VK955_07130, partial [Xanthobacteraceae bacterium]|nr:hypothetical protein [Xanthobacteraceae bacterium]
MAKIDDQLDVVGRGDNRKTSADGVELAIVADQQADARGTEIGNPGKIQAQMVSAAANQLFDVALQMLAPLVVEASFHFDFESVAELLGGDFHGGSGAHVSLEVGGDGDFQLLGAG